MQWWCSAQGGAWTWSWNPYAGAWLLVLAAGVGYAWLRRRARAAGATEPQEGTRRTVLFAAGALLAWAVLDWPVAALGAGYLATAHMVQYLVLSLLAPPLLLAGVPREAYALLRRRPRLLRVVELSTRPVVALLLFNGVLVLTHLPAVLEPLSSTQAGMFLMDAAWMGAGAAFWWPLLAPVPDREGFHPLYRMGYLFVNTIPGTVVAMFLVFADFPVYPVYELASPVAGIELPALRDQRWAGLLMKFGGAAVHWTVITVIFFRWYRQEESYEPGVRKPPAQRRAPAEAG